MKPITVMVTASGAPGTAALLNALKQNGERDVRLVGTDMSERSIGRHLCDAFHIVPGGADPSFPDAMLEVAQRVPRIGGRDVDFDRSADGRHQERSILSFFRCSKRAARSASSIDSIDSRIVPPSNAQISGCVSSWSQSNSPRASWSCGQPCRHRWFESER